MVQGKSPGPLWEHERGAVPRMSSNGSRWYVNGRGYAVRWRRDHGKARLVMMYCCVTRAPKGKTVHHVNGNKLDNRRDNLAVLDPAEHQRVHDRE